MDLTAKIDFLKRALAGQETTQHLQTGLAASLFVLGLAVVLLSLFSPGLVLPESLQDGETLGGAVVAVSGFIPIFVGRRDKIAALRILLTQYQRQKLEAPDEQEIAKLDQYFDQYFSQVLGG